MKAYRITEVSERDAYFHQKEDFIGKIIPHEVVWSWKGQRSQGEEWWATDRFVLDGNSVTFYEIKVEEVKVEEKEDERVPSVQHS